MQKLSAGSLFAICSVEGACEVKEATTERRENQQGGKRERKWGLKPSHTEKFYIVVASVLNVL